MLYTAGPPVFRVAIGRSHTGTLRGDAGGSACLGLLGLCRRPSFFADATALASTHLSPFLYLRGLGRAERQLPAAHNGKRVQHETKTDASVQARACGCIT